MRSIAPLTCLAVMLAASSASATTWFPGSSSPIAAKTDVSRDSALGRAALNHVRARGPEMGVASMDFVVDRVIPSRTGAKVVKLRQSIDGVPVLGGGAVVMVREDGVVRRVGVDVAAHLAVDTHPDLDAEDALASLEASLGRTLPAAEKSRLVIGRMGEGRLLWELDVRDSLGGTRYWVDAHDGLPVMKQDLAMDVLGRVYTKNEIESPTPEDVELQLFDPQTDPAHLNGWGGLLTVTNSVSGNSQNGYTVEQTLVPNSGQDFLYDQPADPLDVTDGFAQVNLFYHLTQIRQFYQALGAPVNTPSWRLTAVANAREGSMLLDNASFSPMGVNGDFSAPNVILIGQGSQIDFAYDSDVFKHEFGHYVAYNTVNYNLGQGNFDELGISPFSGAIDEGLADYFACSDNDDAELGEATLFPLGAGRDLTVTTKSCPDDMVGEVHADGEIIGSVSWSVRGEVGKAIGDKLIYGAMLTLDPGANFDDFAKGILATADDLVTAGDLTAEQRTAVEGILAERGLDDCGRIVGIAAGQERRGFMIGLDIIGQFVGGGCAQAQQFGVELPTLFHYAYKPGASDVAVKIATDMTPDSNGDLDYTIYARANEPVHFNTGGGFIPTVDLSDYSVVATTEQGELIIDASSTPPFDPSATYDIVVVNRSCPDLQMVLTANPHVPVDPGEGGGGAGAGGQPANGGGGATGEGGQGGGGEPTDDTDDGCGCKVVGGAGAADHGPTAIALAALAAVAIRTRRRTRK